MHLKFSALSSFFFFFFFRLVLFLLINDLIHVTFKFFFYWNHYSYLIIYDESYGIWVESYFYYILDNKNILILVYRMYKNQYIQLMEPPLHFFDDLIKWHIWPKHNCMLLWFTTVAFRIYNNSHLACIICDKQWQFIV